MNGNHFPQHMLITKDSSINKCHDKYHVSYNRKLGYQLKDCT